MTWWTKRVSAWLTIANTIIALAALVLVLVFSVSSVKAPVPGEVVTEEALPVVRYVNFKVYDPVYVGIDKGFYREEGVEVKIIGDVIAGPNAIQAVAGGSAEAGLSSIPALALANAQGLPIQGVVDIQTTLESQSLQKWYTLKGSPIQKLEDVMAQEEKPIYCVNIWRSSFHTTSLMAFDQRGIPEDAVDWRLLSFADQIPALIEGECDVIGLIQPYQSYLEQEYGDKVRVVLDDYDDIYGSKHVSLIFVNRIWAREQPELAQKFATGTAKAINWIEKHQDEATAIVSKYTEIPESAVPVYHFTENGCVRHGDIEFWMDYLKERGDMTEEWVSADDVGTDEYNILCGK